MAKKVDPKRMAALRADARRLETQADARTPYPRGTLVNRPPLATVQRAAQRGALRRGAEARTRTPPTDVDNREGVATRPPRPGATRKLICSRPRSSPPVCEDRPVNCRPRRKPGGIAVASIEKRMPRKRSGLDRHILPTLGPLQPGDHPSRLRLPQARRRARRTCRDRRNHARDRP
jgi:hypothetical protein